MEPFHEAGASERHHDRSARQRLVGRPGRRQLACDRPDRRGVPRLDRDDLRRGDERLGGEVRGLAVVRRYAEVLELDRGGEELLPVGRRRAEVRRGRLRACAPSAFSRAATWSSSCPPTTPAYSTRSDPSALCCEASR